MPSIRGFEDAWDVFCESQLRYLDWSNVVAAGGAVAGCLAPVPEKYLKGDLNDINKKLSWAESRKKTRKYFHDIAYSSSDVDLFLYGFKDNPAAAE